MQLVFMLSSRSLCLEGFKSFSPIPQPPPPPPPPHLQGKPRPVVTWLKDDVPLEDKGVGVRTSDVDTILFVRSAERSHSAKYTLSVQIEDTVARADIHIQVVGQCCTHTHTHTNTLGCRKPTD